MSIRDIPVTVLGPGSQPGESDGATLEYINMPSDMSRYRAPDLPGPADVQHLAGAREAMRWLSNALRREDGSKTPQLADLSGLDAESRELVNQVLGEGEVSITCSAPTRARTQESVLAGVWRTFCLDDDDHVVADLLEVAELPTVVRAASEGGAKIDTSTDGVPEDVINALPILVELQAHLENYTAGKDTEVINLSLLPLSDADLEFLDERLGRGPIDILSRAYGKCQIISTATANVWWVRYYNSMNTLILNTLEVVDVPMVVAAAAEDLRDSADRLAQILKPYWPDDA